MKAHCAAAMYMEARSRAEMHAQARSSTNTSKNRTTSFMIDDKTSGEYVTKPEVELLVCYLTRNAGCAAEPMRPPPGCCPPAAAQPQLSWP